MRIAMIEVHYSWLRPYTYINVSGTYAYAASEKLPCEYMSVFTQKFFWSRRLFTVMLILLESKMTS